MPSDQKLAGRVFSLASVLRKFPTKLSNCTLAAALFRFPFYPFWRRRGAKCSDGLFVPGKFDHDFLFHLEDAPIFSPYPPRSLEAVTRTCLTQTGPSLTSKSFLATRGEFSVPKPGSREEIAPIGNIRLPRFRSCSTPVQIRNES